MAPRLAHLPRSVVLGGLAAATAIGLLTGAVMQQAMSTSDDPSAPVVAPSDRPTTTEAGDPATPEVVEGPDGSQRPAAKTSKPKQSGTPTTKAKKSDETKPAKTTKSSKPSKSPKPPKPTKTKPSPTPSQSIAVSSSASR
jgi:putative endonuclease